MNIEDVREYCLSKPGTTESTPFDEVSPVYKVMGKIFCIASLDLPHFVNLKCDPEYAMELRERYEHIQPGYHMDKKMWNSVYLNSGLPRDLIISLIDDSYNLVVAKLKKSLQEELKKYEK